MHYAVEAVIARPRALKSCVKPSNMWSSAVRDLQIIRFEASEVYSGDFSILIPGTLRRSNSDFSACRMCVWRESIVERLDFILPAFY